MLFIKPFHKTHFKSSFYFVLLCFVQSNGFALVNEAAQYIPIDNDRLKLRVLNRQSDFNDSVIEDIEKFKHLVAQKNKNTTTNKAQLATLTVGPGCVYSNLQDAVNAATDGDIIRVRGTTFSGSNATVNIYNKSLIINGGYGVGCNTLTNTRTTFDAAGQNDSVFEINDTVGGMTAFISGFIIKNGEQDNDFGGGIEISGKSTSPILALISNVSILSNQSELGGGMHITDATVQLLSGTKIYNNTALLNGANTGDGGGVYCQNSSITLVSATVGYAFGNTAQENGGGLYLDNCSLTLDASNNSNFSDVLFNTATKNGGGVYAINSSLIRLYGGQSSISVNNAKNGGGVAIYSASKVFSDNGKFNSNTASINGGGFIISGVGTRFDMDRYNSYPCMGKCSEISNNLAFRGGAGYIGSESFVDIESSWIEGNKANDSSFVFSNAGNLKIKSSMLLHNSSQGPAQTLILTIGQFASTTISLSTIADTQVGVTANASMFDVTISSAATLTLDSNIIWENDSSYALFSNDSSQVISIERNIMQFNEGGSNLQADPLFLVPGSNYHIAPSSPAVDFGSLALANGVSIKDIDAESRGLSNIPDAGADESNLRVGLAGGVCAYNSIATAIAAAADGDTIYISPGVYIENPGLIDKSLILVPATALCDSEEPLSDSASIVIDGDNQFRTNGGIFEIRNSASVTLKYMSLFSAQADYGGNLYVAENSFVYLTSVVITGGTANYFGGGIFSNNSDVILSSSIVTDNSAKFGGGVYVNDSLLELRGNSLIGKTNGVGNTSIVSGGGVSINGGSIEMFDSSSIQGNQSVVGGGVAVYASTVANNIINGEIKGNTATSDGGGIHINASNLGASTLINGVNINYNQSDNGSGVFYNSNSSGGLLNIFSSNINNNSATTDGGGVMVAGAAALSSLTSTSSSILSNSAGVNGGGINIANTSNFIGIGNMMINNNNSSQKGGGVYLGDAGSITLNGGSLANNYSINSSGGGIYSATNNASITLTANNNIDMNINNNRAMSGLGGAIFLWGGTLEIGRTSQGTGKTTLSGNQSASGGAIDMTGVSFNIIGDVQFANNISSNSGGAITASNSTGRIATYTNDRPEFSGNSASLGGAIFFAGGGPLQLLGVDFGVLSNGNQAQGKGGAIYLLSVSNAELINLKVGYNSANSGGGVYIEGGNTLIDTYMSNLGYSGGFTDATLYGGVCDPISLPAGNYCSHFFANTSINNGAAITIGAAANVNINHSTFESHTDKTITLSDQGVLVANGVASATFSYDLFTGNSGDNVLEFGTNNLVFDLSQLTFANNSSPSTLSQVGLTNVNGSIKNSIFWGNTAGNSLDIFVTGSCNITQDNSLTGMSVDPMLDVKFNLTTGSPAIDACAGSSAYDLNDQLSPLDGDNQGSTGSEYDMGAFESIYVSLSDDIFKDGFE